LLNLLALKKQRTDQGKMKILIVEDEKPLSEAIAHYLRAEGYICETASDFHVASEKTALYNYDCLILDISLPYGSGLEIVRALKQLHNNTGIIIISAKNALDDKIAGLDLGADDYISKPFHLSELHARLKSLLRRKHFEGRKEIQVNEICLVPDLQEVKVHDRPLDLTKKEYDLLLYFITNKNKVLTKEAIAEHLWGDNIETCDSFDFIYTHIKNLRKKMLENGCEDYIKTIYGMGYKFSQ
jgi:DNA-binding response OmpR family regulator